MTKSTALALPARSAIQQSIDNGTDEDYDLVRLYYSWYTGWFYRHRLQMVNALLGTQKVERLLEVGVGSGIFVKTLLTHADSVVGIDIHDSFNGVRAMLKQEAVDLNRVELLKGSIFEIPSPDASFDAVVCVSVLEHFADPLPALNEMRRVVKPGGILALGFPARSPVTNMLFAALGYHALDIHPASHSTILAGIHQALSVETVSYFPLPMFPLYVACRAQRTP